ncbi:MAG: hypothetical protein LC650_03005, partial [Actinobacteria bacterium]|nr:hypothetical protein [Actinomycetota bacterium]
AGAWNDAALLTEVADSELAILELVGVPEGYDGYEFMVTVSGKCTPPVPSDVVTLTVDQKPEIALQPVNESSCEQLDVTFTVDPGATTAPAYL